MGCSPPPSDVAHTRSHRAGCPGTGPAVAVSIYVRPVRAAEGRVRLTPALVEGLRKHVGAVRGVAPAAPHSCGGVPVGLRLGARPETLLQRRRIHAARPSSVRRGSYAPASCGLPCGWSGGGRFHLCAARPGRRGFAIAGGIHAASVLAAIHHKVGGIHAADLQCRMGTAYVARRAVGVRWRTRRLHSRGRASVGRSSSRGRRPRERWCLRVTRAGMDAGGFAQPAGQRPAITKPIPRRNSPGEPAGLPAGLSNVGPTRVEPHEAATLQQHLEPAHQPEELLKTSRMDAATAPRPTALPKRVRD